MDQLDSLTFEVWYQYGPTRRRVAAFHFWVDAKKYLQACHPNDSHYSIVENAE